MRKKIPDFLLLILLIITVFRSFLYLTFGSDSHFKIFRYLNLSPLPVAFVHQSFFAKKEILLTYASETVSWDYMNSDTFFTNRSNYRNFMFMFDAPMTDRNKVVQYLYCQNIGSIGLVRNHTEKLIAVEFIYYFKEKTQRTKFICSN